MLTILESDFGDIFIINRYGEGFYQLNVNTNIENNIDIFKPAKSLLQPKMFLNDNDTFEIETNGSNNSLSLLTKGLKNGLYSPRDGVLNNTPIEFQVYN